MKQILHKTLARPFNLAVFYAEVIVLSQYFMPTEIPFIFTFLSPDSDDYFACSKQQLTTRVFIILYHNINLLFYFK